LIKLQRPIGDAVEKVAVVADDQDRLVRFQQKILQPLGGVDVEMVGGFVQQHQIRLGEEELREQETILLSSGQRFQPLLITGHGEPKAGKNSLDLVVQVVNVVMMKLVLDELEPPLQALSLGLVRGRTDGMSEFFRLMRIAEQFI
jgi:hypothetical protein